MFTNFDNTTLAIIEEAKAYSLENLNLGKMGTEAFLYVMFKDENSLCHLLLEEYRVSLMEIEDILHSYVIIRNQKHDYTDKCKEVFEIAKMIAGENGSKMVYEEHLFYALLSVKNSLFSDQIKRLNLNQSNLAEDVKEYFNLAVVKEIENYSTNLTELARQGKLDKVIGRDDYINRMEIVLNRKNKNNILLIGSAGVGKTALVEGLASRIKQKEVIALNVASLIANTKYRGDFESRINRILADINDNSILFIDEIHTIMGAGGTDNNLDLANILKPYLARGNFHLIGATTIEEYQNHICKDKALTRRFQPIFVTEPTMDETLKIIDGIKADFIDFHKVNIADDILDYVLNLANKITNRKYPDKAIDLLDEAMSIAKKANAKTLTLKHLDDAFSNVSGLLKGNIKGQYLYPELEAYYLDYYLDMNKNHLVTLEFTGDKDNLKLLIKEMQAGFGIQDEMILELDLASFNEEHSVSTLFGSPAGYIGYEEGGIISEHLAKFPAQIMVIKNLDKASSSVRVAIKQMLNEEFFYDKKGRKLSIKHCAFIIISNQKKQHNLGFIDVMKENDKHYDLCLGNRKRIEKTTTSFIEKHGFHIQYDEKDYLEHELIYKKSIVSLLEDYEVGEYQILYNDKLAKVEISRII